MKKATEALRRGDVILAVDGHDLDTPVKVTRFVEILSDGTVHVEVEQPKEWVTSPSRWFRFDEVEVGRPVTLAGHKLIKTDDEHYQSYDGKYHVEKDWLHTECEDQHPVKMTRELQKLILAHKDAWPPEAVYAAENFRQTFYEAGRLKAVKGYLCPGGEEHAYAQWIAYTEGQRDWQGEWCDTATEAASYLPEEV